LQSNFSRQTLSSFKKIPGVKNVQTKKEWNAAIQQMADDGFPSEEHRRFIEQQLGRAE